MQAVGGLFWRLVPDVRPPERTRFLFFASLSTLIGLAQTLGLVGSEALFLARLGAERLPETFIAASVTTVVGSMLYAFFVGGVRNDRLFIQMLLWSGLALAGLTGVAAGPALWVLPVLFCLFYLGQAVFLNHFWNFASDYFDTLTSKRLFPLFTVGSSLGGLIGGGLAVLVSSSVGPVALVGAWGLSFGAAALLLRLGRRRLRRWGPLDLEEADETSVEGIQAALGHLRASGLGRWLVISALAMVLALFLVQYLYSDVFAKSFPDPKALATFFGVYLAVTNLIEIAVELLLTPWLIQRFGVASANLIQPVLTLLSFGGLAFHPGLASAVFARMNRELMDNAVSQPVRSLVYNAMPMRFRGRTRAFLEGIVVYAGMSVAGMALLLLGEPDPMQLCAGGAAVALFYLAANLAVRREYLQALVRELRAGRLDLTDVGGEIGGWAASRLAALWEELLREETGRPTRSMLQLVPALAERGILDPLVRAASHSNPEIRRVCIDALASSGGDAGLGPIALALDDPDARVRLAALRGLARPDLAGSFALPRLRDLMRDPDPRVRAEAMSLLGPHGIDALEAMLRSRDAAEAVAAFAVAPPSLLDAALARARDPDPAVRAAALECIARAPVANLSRAELLEALRDGDPRVRRASVALLANQGDPDALAALAGALGDASLEVQHAAEAILGSLGEEGLAAVEASLRSQRERAVEGALRVAAASGARRSREVLTGELRHRARQLWYDLIAIQRVPEDASVPGRFLRAAFVDDMLRSRRLAFHILALLEDPSVIEKVETSLRFDTSRARGDALEVLSNLGDRESAQLLVLGHESGDLADRIPFAERYVAVPKDSHALVEAALASDARWIRMAARALMAPAAEPTEEEELMDRLLALKQVPLFEHLSLEQLEAVQQVTKEVEYMPNEVIVREGEPGGELYLLIEGRVRVYKNYGTLSETSLSTQEAISYFGEMAILDGEPRAASVVTASPARLLSLDGRSLKELILLTPEISFEIFRVLTQRVRAAERRLSGG